MLTTDPLARPEAEAEIEVTEEMIEAGKEELYSFSWQAESEESAAQRVYLAMRRLEPRRPDRR